MSIDAILGFGGSRESGSTNTSSSSGETEQTQTTDSSGSEAPSGGGGTVTQPTTTSASAASQPEAAGDVLRDPPLRANAETVILAQTAAERPAEQEIAYARSLAETYQQQSRQDAILSTLAAAPTPSALDVTQESLAAREGDPYGDIIGNPPEQG